MEKIMQLLNDYKKKALDRKKNYGLAPRPLTEDEVKGIVEALSLKGLNKKSFSIFEEESLDKLLVRLLSVEVRRGTFPSSHLKAEGLSKIIKGELETDYISKDGALDLLDRMKGGAASVELVGLLEEGYYVEEIVAILKDTVLVNKEEFDRLTALDSNPLVVDLLKSWAEGDFTKEWKLKDSYKGLGIKVGDNITTGHLSPSKNADSRTDQPLHSQYIMDGREDQSDFLDRLAKLKDKGEDIFLVAGSALGEGSSRKSATYTILQVLGKPVEGEAEKKEGGVVVAKSMAPIFQKSLVASAVLPVICDTETIEEGDSLEVDLAGKRLIVNGVDELDIKLPIPFQMDKIAAGGMTSFDAGNELKKWALSYCTDKGIEVKDTDKSNEEGDKRAQTLVQKIVGMNRLDGKDTILPGETAPVRIRGVYSQDTTGPMTLEEYQSMAGGLFGADYVVQSLCHTGECPSSEDRDLHKYIDRFVTSRGGVCLETGEGIIHTIANRFVLPTDVVVGGDSHTRTPRGVSFPAASDIIAGAMKYGKQDLTLDESVRVIFKGQPKKGITARDLVSTLVIYADKTVGKDIYSGRIIEMEGVEFLDSDERYILTNAVAERSASAGTVPSDKRTIETIEGNLEYLRSRDDAQSSPSVKKTIEAIEEFLEDPILLKGDEDADYAATIEIPLDEVNEPIVAKPHHPDNVAYLSEVSGIDLDEVFIGSCVGGDLESIRAAARIVEGHKVPNGLNFVVCPASRDIYNDLAKDGSLAKLTEAGATITMPGCGLCMGNKRRIGSGSTALTTTTRNYQSRIGPADSKTYLGSAYVAAIAAVLGKFPTVDEYFNMFK